MLETLKQKILSWTPELADQFHGNIVRYHFMGNSIWETTPTGYYLYSPFSAEYRDYNGTRFVLEAGDQTTNLNFKKDLSDYLDSIESIKMEKPVIIETTDIYGVPYTYSKHVNPVSTRGLSITSLKDVTTNISQTLIDLSKVSIKEFENLVINIDSMTQTQGNLNYPAQIDFGVLRYDDTSQQFFWSGNIEFTGDRSIIKNGILAWLDNCDTAFSQFFKQSINISAELTTYANTQCTIYQNP